MSCIACRYFALPRMGQKLPFVCLSHFNPSFPFDKTKMQELNELSYTANVTIIRYKFLVYYNRLIISANKIDVKNHNTINTKNA